MVTFIQFLDEGNHIVEEVKYRVRATDVALPALR
jgi:hypothetical protein